MLLAELFDNIGENTRKYLRQNRLSDKFFTFTHWSCFGVVTQT